ncbi:hypothetical protein HYV84_06405 [Candidatus Woesearchaeota archaeon]|nr:hypothetical protein [Candidatus Woesearchaeota archaeon]
MADGGMYKKIKVHIVKKLFDMRCWMGDHTSIHHMQIGLPGHARDSRIISKAVDELIHEGWVIAKPTHYGLELALNIQKKIEIVEFIEEHGL